MHGDIVGAFLSDTDDTDLSGTSLIANGDFSSSSTAAFTNVAGGTAAVVGGLLKLTDTAGAFCYASAPFTTVVGDQYYVTVDIVNNSNTAPSNYIRCGNSHNGTEFHDTNYGTGYGTKTFYFTATATTTYLTLISGHGAGNPFGHWDNVFAYKLDNDRTVSAKGLRPYGTITKTAVANGAELVSYSGFEIPESGVSLSVTNALIQAYNSSLSGTQFVFSGWFKTSTNADYQYVVQISDTSTNQTIGGLSVFVTGGSNAGLPYMWSATGSSGGESGIFAGSRVDDNKWHHFVAIFDNTNKTLYVDGVSRGSSSISGTITSSFTGAEVYIGMHRQVKSGGDNKYRHYLRGHAALVRISVSVPSPEQVKKMYNDEKQLFQENAKCTLYGSSDAVTAVAYDDSNDTVHVGTSAGRSDFTGLDRINNTTTAVTTAISASNGLVAEQ